MSSISNPRIVLLSYYYFGLEGLIPCHVRGLDILSTTTGYYDRVDLCMCEFLLDAVCDVAFKRVSIQHPTSKWALAEYSLQPVTSEIFIHPSVSRRGYIALIFKFLVKRLCFSLGSRKTINGFSFVPSALAVKQTETLDFSCPVVFSRIDFFPTFSIVVLDSTSYQTAVSSMVIMSLWQ